MSVEAPTEARPVAPAAHPEDVDRAVAAAHAAEKALVEKPAPKPERSRSQVRHDAEMERLSLHRMTVHSEALRAAIDAAMTQKQRTHDLARAHIAADDAADEFDDEGCAQAAAAEAAWQASREELDTAALLVAHAPFSDLNDVVARAEAFAEIVGRPDKDAPPEFDEDHILMLGSYQAAIMEMIERQPSRGDWDDAVAGLQEIERRIAGLTENADAERRAKAYLDRDAAITDLLSMEPPHLDGVLLLVDLIRENWFLKSRTYRDRAASVGTDQVTVNDIRSSGEDGLVRALALVAQHIARLRDLEMPRDWREAMRDFGRCHPVAPDALRQAFEGCMHVPHLKAVWLSGRPEHELPVLVFGGPDGEHWATPDGVLKGGF